MALKDCKECGKQISTEAESCPHCGAKQPKPTSRLSILIAGLVLIGILQSAWKSDPPAAPKPPPDPAGERRLKEEVGALLYIKGTMKNPASFELVDFIRTPENSLCITYRGTNSFNAVITQHHVINNSVNSNNAKDWKAHCAGRFGEDVSKARHALQ